MSVSKHCWQRAWSLVQRASPSRSLVPALLLMATVAWPPAAQAATSAMELLHRMDFNWEQRVDRYSLAKDLRTRIAELQERVPPQKPAELARLGTREKRLQGNDQQGLSRLFLSAAYQHRQLERLLTELLAGLDCVLTAETLAPEMRCWSRTAIGLLKEEELRLALATLRRSRRMPPRREEPLMSKDPQLWFAQFGRGVLEYLIDPYLAAEGVRDAS